MNFPYSKACSWGEGERGSSNCTLRDTFLVKSGDSTLWHTRIYAYLTSWVYLTDRVRTELLEQEMQLLHSR